MILKFYFKIFIYLKILNYKFKKNYNLKFLELVIFQTGNFSNWENFEMGIFRTWNFELGISNWKFFELGRIEMFHILLKS